MLQIDLIREGRLAVEELKAITFLIEQQYGTNIPTELLLDLIIFMNDQSKTYRRHCVERWDYCDWCKS